MNLINELRTRHTIEREQKGQDAETIAHTTLLDSQLVEAGSQDLLTSSNSNIARELSDVDQHVVNYICS